MKANSVVGSSHLSRPRFTQKEAARALGMCRQTLGRLTQAGRIGHYDVNGRLFYSDAHLEAFLTQNERPVNVIGGGRNA